uniref:Uncharacterized protein n=1 Tax=Favella ehrenbergii TaxID=182087 RepID=A0A7S3HY51_9SPIT
MSLLVILSLDNVVAGCGRLHELHRLRFLSLEREVGLSEVVLDAIDTDHHHGLAMADSLLVALSAALLEHNRLLALSFLFNGCVDACVLDLWATDSRVVWRGDHQHIANADLLTNFERKQFLNSQHVVLENFSLLSVDSDNCENIIRVGRQCNTLLRAMDINHSILSLD